MDMSAYFLIMAPMMMTATSSSRSNSQSVGWPRHITKPANLDGETRSPPRYSAILRFAKPSEPASNAMVQPKISLANTDDSTISNPPDTPREAYHRRRRALKRFLPRKLLQDARNEHQLWRSQHQKPKKQKPETRHPFVEDIRTRRHHARFQQLREELTQILPQDRSASVVSDASGLHDERTYSLNGDVPHRHHLHGLRRHRSEPINFNSAARTQANSLNSDFAPNPSMPAEQFRRAVPGAALGVPVYFQYSCGHLKVRSATGRQRLEIKLRRHRPLMFAIDGICPICVEMTTTVSGSRRTSGMA